MSDNIVKVEVTGSATVWNVDGLKAQVLKGLDEAEAVELSLAKVEEVDVCFLQFLIAANNEAAERGKSLLFPDGKNDHCVEMAELMGLLVPTDDEDEWPW